MATVVAAPPALSGELALFHTTDPLLGNSPVLVFHGPAATIGATSSRIQVHVFTPAGLGSYARLSVSPNSPFYSAVTNLPREEQGDEVCRGLAFGLKKYFHELNETVKQTWTAQVKAPSPGALFGDDHIAILATRMTRIENVSEVVGDISEAFCEQRLSWLDVDVVLPPGTMKERPDSSAGSEEMDELELLKRQFGRYAELIQTFGEVTFLPTSKLKRAPSKANAIGRSASFLRSQKENVRKQLTELVATEESYVDRLGELQDVASNLGADLKARYQQQLAVVFSPTIARLHELHSAFFEDLHRIYDETDSGAVEDIEASQDEEITHDRATPPLDSQGLQQVAKCLCDWIPKFSESYRDYLSTHATSSQTLRTLLRNGDSLALEIQGIGEQKLTSLLIEPVQRLPRYNLYIDGMTKQLPARHPALKPLLKARDLITEVCAESEGNEATTMVERLQTRTLGWPLDIDIAGRLVTAADYVELMPPYAFDGCDGPKGVLFLFTDGVIVVEKSAGSRATARSLLTEIESGSIPSRSVESLADTIGDLHFVRRLQLDALHCTESHEGHALQLMTFFQLSAGALAPQEPILDSCQTLRLENAYDGRASRFVEEVAKARVEGRFSEAERESSQWEFRGTDPASDSLNLLSAVFEDSNEQFIRSRGPLAPIRISVDAERHSARARAGQDGLQTVINLASHRDGDWRLTVESVDGTLGREHVDTPDLVPALRRKVASLVSARLAIEQPAMAACVLLRNSDILQSIGLQAVGQDGAGEKLQLAPRERVHRPKSPKKLLSSFLSSVGPGSEPPTFLQKPLPGMPPPNHSSIPRMPSHTSQKPPSRESRPSSRDQAAPFPSTSDLASNQLKKIEDTLSAYILALQARKGNIVGKNLKLRLVADQLQVDELYNGLLEDPNMMVLAAQAPLDVLFAAFEKFLNVAWKDYIGQVMPGPLLQEIQTKAETVFPTDFDEYFKTALTRLAPQNQRAFKAIMKLLADLLDGTGNDGDRGILTACFAEVLVTEGNPHDYIALIDRFVDDTDTYFGEPVDTSVIITPTYTDTGSMNSHKRARSINSGSLTSNTSSLRRKFGLGHLTRENSKSEQESKVASVWRTLSKSTRSDYSPGNSISKGSLGRSRSIDTEPSTLGYRPTSSDGPRASAQLAVEAPPGLPRTVSTNNLGLSTIGEHPSFIPTGPPRKKRRSSLSDLMTLESTPKKEPLTPSSPRRGPLLTPALLEEKALPESPAPPTPSSKDNPGRFGSPLQNSPRSRLPSSFRRDLSPGPARVFANAAPELPRPKTSGGENRAEMPRPKTSGDRPDEVVITSRPTSNIPSLVPRASSPSKHVPSTPNRTGLSERPGAGNIVKKPSPQTEKTSRTRSTTIGTPATLSSPRKLRMQSPQKLRERLQNEQSSMSAAQSSLQDELSKIGEELTSSTGMRNPARGSRTIAAGRGSFSQPSHMDLAQRVLKVEGQLPKQMEELNSRISAIQGDLATSLSVSETKCKKLDELYREANGENEALYARFNDELSRILKAVRGGEGVEELKKKLRESQEEAVKLRRETSRLKRENVGLRAQLKE